MKTIQLGDVQMAVWKKGNALFPKWMRENPKYAKDIKKCPADEIVLPPKKKYTVVIDYPLSVPAKFELYTGRKGLTRVDMVSAIVKVYKHVYAVEDGTASRKARLGIEGGAAPLLNCEQSDGKYGIWGHCLGDLVLCSMEVDKDKITLGVDS